MDDAKYPDPGSEQEVVETLAEDDTLMDSSTILKYQQTFQDLLIKEGSTELEKSPMPEGESAFLVQQKHIAAGRAIYERMTKEVHETKTDANALISKIKRISKLDKCNYFVVQEVDINLEGEAKGTRLKTGTNHKRARTVNFQYLDLHNRLLELATNAEHDTNRTARSRSEEVEIEACERGRSLQRAGDTEPWTEEGHTGDDMSERSSGTKRQTRSSLASTIEGSADLIGGADASGSVEEEILESADADKAGFPIFPRAEVGEAVVESSARFSMDPNTANITNSQPVYIRGSSKRIRPEDVQKVIEKEGKKLEPSESSKKEVDASPAEGQDQQSATASKALPETRKTTWDFGRRYNNFKLNCLPDYGPSAHLPATPQEAEAVMPQSSIGGGFRPVNRLSAKTSNPPYVPQRPEKKAFNLKEDAKKNRQENEHPPKRQRVDNGSSRSPIEVDGTSPHPSRYSVPSSTKSGHSQTLHDRERTASFGRESSLQEIRQVGKSMKPPRQRIRKGSAAEGVSVISGKHRFATDTFEHSPRDDKNDPISDDELEIVHTSKKVGGPSSGPSSRKSFPRVEIPFSPNNEQIAGSRGTKVMETEEVSRHFIAQGHAHHRGINKPNGRLNKENLVGKSSQGTWKQNGNHLEESEADELSTSHYDPIDQKHRDEAAGLLANRQLHRESLANAKGKQSHQPSFDVSDSTDDEAQNRKADIPPAIYTSSKGKSKKAGEDVYEIVQVFSKPYHWLLSGEKKWWLHQHCKANLLQFRNDEGLTVADLDLRPGTVQRIEKAPQSSKMIIHKPVDQSAKRASQICVEFLNSDESNAFANLMKRSHCTIGLIDKKSDYLDKVFNTTKAQLKPKSQRPLVIGEAEQIELLENNSRRRQTQNSAEQAQDRRRKPTSGQRVIDQFQEDTNQPRGAEGSRRSTRGRSSPDRFDEDDLKEGFRNTEVHPDTFYRKSDGAIANGESALGTRSSARAATNSHLSPVYRQSPRQRQRSLTPEPERWTFKNPDWVMEKNWKSSVIYPPDGKKKATVDLQDIQRLDEGEFLNDNLIMFYLHWLEDHLEKERPDLASRIYFHNTFFYTRLTKHGKGKSGGINYEAVERWTSKIDLLKYDYIVVPVNETVHWYVAIICNAPKLLKQSEEEKMSQPEVNDREVATGSSNVEAEDAVIPSSPKSPAKTLPDEVDSEMKEMTLEDKDSEGRNAGTPGTLAATVPSEENDTEMTDLDPPPANVVSDLVEQKPIQANQAKKSKRRSTPAPRKYKPDEPRIITLDSLGLSHSPTCTNLRKYILQEIKAKKGIEIDDPGSLGMTAKNIPQQNNHCDCGLFLLTYIEEFLKRPDEFVHDILQQNEQDFKNWRSASDMRAHIRERLFELQEKQVQEADLLKKEMAKNKQATKAGDKTASASSSKPASRETSKSARESPEKDQPLPETRNQVRSENLEKSKKQQEPTPPSVQHPEQVNVDSPAKAEPPSKPNAVESHSDEAQNMQMKFSHALGFEENKDGRSPELKTSASQPITIEDSQDMDIEEQQHNDISSPVKKINNHKTKRSSVHDGSRGAESSNPKRAIEIPESPGKESPDKVFCHPHPLPNSSQEQEQVLHSRTSGRHTKDSKHRTSGKSKARNGVGNHRDRQEWNDSKVADPDESLSNVQLIAGGHGHQEDDGETPNTPPDVTYLTTSSPELVSASTVSATNRSRGKPTAYSPASLKRPSSIVAGNGPSSSKRPKVVVDLDGEQRCPNAKLRNRPAMGQLLDASDRAVIGKRASNPYAI